MKTIAGLLTLTSLATFAAPFSGAAVLEVPGVYPTIQAAVDAAADRGDVILVGPGQYSEDVEIVGKALSLTAPFGPDQTSVLSVTWRDIFMEEEELAGSLHGFTVQGSLQASVDGQFGVHGSVVRGPSYCDAYGNMDVAESTFLADAFFTASGMWHCATVTRCSFRDAILNVGGGEARVTYCALDGGDLRVSGTTSMQVMGNQLINGAGIVASAHDYDAFVYENTVIGADTAIEVVSAGWWMLISVIDNIVRDSAIGIHARSGALVKRSDVADCGVGILLGHESAAQENTIRGCGDGIVVHGRFFEHPPEFHVANNTIYGCTRHGVVYDAPGPGELRGLYNNLVAANEMGVRVSQDIDVALIRCNDVWGNPGGNWFGVQNPTGTNGNVAIDPMLCAPLEGDFHLREGSPCAPSSPPNPECDLIGAHGVGCVPSGAPEPLQARGAGLGVRVAPNPFGGGVQIMYVLPESLSEVGVEILIFDASGRLVRRHEIGQPGPGEHTVTWDGRNHAGSVVAAGTYFCTVRSGPAEETRRLTKMR